jgi:hypothetical protein
MLGKEFSAVWGCVDSFGYSTAVVRSTTLVTSFYRRGVEMMSRELPTNVCTVRSARRCDPYPVLLVAVRRGQCRTLPQSALTRRVCRAGEHLNLAAHGAQ